MQGTIIVNKINVRAEPRATALDVGDLYLNDKVYGDVSNGWIRFERIYKANGVIDDATKGYAAVYNPADPNDLFMKLENILEPDSNPFPDPEPTPTVKPLTVTIGGDDYISVTVVLEPKP